MRAEAKSMSFLHRSERKLIDNWATTIDDIAEGLTRALADHDRERLGRFWWAARFAAIPLATLTIGGITGLGEGAGARAFDYFTGNEKVTTCAAQVVDVSDTFGHALFDGPLPDDVDDDEWGSQEFSPAMEANLVIQPLEIFYGLSYADMAARINRTPETVMEWRSGSLEPTSEDLALLHDLERQVEQQLKPLPHSQIFPPTGDDDYGED
jgi:hypothetical protein